MITYVRGEIVELREGIVVVDVNNIGYRIFISARAAGELPPVGTEVRMHTYLHVKEDAMQLYGFLTSDELDIFKLLLGVNGIGPKAALGILSVLTANDLRFAVLSDDEKAISKAPGIGKKTAQKLILELRDKLSLEDAIEKNREISNAASAPKAELNDARNEAVQALTALGYSASEALRAVKQVELTEDMDAEAILKAALKKMI